MKRQVDGGMTTRRRRMMKMALAEVDELQGQRHFASKAEEEKAKGATVQTDAW